MRSFRFALLITLGCLIPLCDVRSQLLKTDREIPEEPKASAEAGDASAQYRLGRAYATGEGAAKDEVEAVKWFRKAADQNNASAQYGLGRAYALGEGVPKDAAGTCEGVGPFFLHFATSAVSVATALRRRAPNAPTQRGG